MSRAWAGTVLLVPAHYVLERPQGSEPPGLTSALPGGGTALGQWPLPLSLPLSLGLSLPLPWASLQPPSPTVQPASVLRLHLQA